MPWLGDQRGVAREPPKGPARRPVPRSARPAAAPALGIKRQRSRAEVTRQVSAVSTQTLTYVFDRDGFYEGLAGRLLAARPLTKKLWRGHWLCKQLDEAARGLDPSTYAQQAQRPAREGFRSLGFPDFMSTVMGAGAGVGLNIALGETPMNRLVTALRVLGALVCPNLATCPARNAVANTFVAPELADQLKNMEPPS